MDGDATDINDILCTFWKVRKSHRVKVSWWQLKTGKESWTWIVEGCLSGRGEFVSAGVTYHQPSGFFLARPGRRRDDVVAFLKDMLQQFKMHSTACWNRKLEFFFAQTAIQSCYELLPVVQFSFLFERFVLLRSLY